MTDHRPWFRVWRRGVPKTVAPFPHQSVFHLLADSAAGFPNSTAIAFLGKHLSYRELLHEVERFSAVLAGLGVQRGDRVGLLLELPAVRDRVVRVPASRRGRGGEQPALHPARARSPDQGLLPERDGRPGPAVPGVGAVAHEAPVREVIVTELTDYMRFPLNLLAPIKFKKDAKHEGNPGHRSRRRARSVVEGRGGLRRGTTTGGRGGRRERRRDARLHRRDDRALEGRHALSLQPVLQRATGRAVHLVLRTREGRRDVHPPFFHSFGLVAMNFGIGQAGKLVLLPRFEVHMALKQLDKEKPSFFPGVPRLFVALNEAPETPKYDLKSVKACISGARRSPERWPRSSGRSRTARTRGGLRAHGDVAGHPREPVRRAEARHDRAPDPDTDCRIVSLEDPDNEVPAGERGELCIKGPQVMLGYYNKPEATTEMIRGGWLHTGDIAIMDDEGSSGSSTG